MYYDITLNPHLLSLVDDIDDVLCDTNQYYYQDKPVPRTTEIISTMIHKEYLIQWAVKLAKYHKDYKKVRQDAAMKGTITHEFIEQTLLGNVVDLETVDPIYQKAVTNAYNSFLDWYFGLINHGNEVICLGAEVRLSCPYYGGTADAILQINGETILFDFKTSNQLSFSYFLQLAAYYYILTEYEHKQIDGVCILMLNKYRRCFTEYPLMFQNPDHSRFFKNCLDTFFSFVYAYQLYTQTEAQYNQIFGGDKNVK